MEPKNRPGKRDLTEEEKSVIRSWADETDWEQFDSFAGVEELVPTTYLLIPRNHPDLASNVKWAYAYQVWIDEALEGVAYLNRSAAEGWNDWYAIAHICDDHRIWSPLGSALVELEDLRAAMNNTENSVRHASSTVDEVIEILSRIKVVMKRFEEGDTSIVWPEE